MDVLCEGLPFAPVEFSSGVLYILPSKDCHGTADALTVVSAT